MSAPLEQIRRRLMETTARLRERAGAGKFAGQLIGPQGLVGGGQVVQKVSTTLDQITQQLLQRRPGILTNLGNIVQQLKPGSRVAAVLGGPTATTAPTPTRQAPPPPPETKPAPGGATFRLRE